MSRVCQLTGTRANNGMAVSHSHIRTKKLQQANLQNRRLWWAEGKRWVNLRVTTRALKTIQKKDWAPMQSPWALTWPSSEPSTPCGDGNFSSTPDCFFQLCRCHPQGPRLLGVLF